MIMTVGLGRFCVIRRYR